MATSSTTPVPPITATGPDPAGGPLVAPPEDEGPRLRLGETPGRLDGAWWPRSREVETELADLVDHFPPEVGRVIRVLYSRPDWSSTPHKVAVARGWLKTGSFPHDDTHLVVLSLGVRQVDLLVVPPETDATVAGTLMEQATADGGTATGSELLAAAGALPTR